MKARRVVIRLIAIWLYACLLFSFLPGAAAIASSQNTRLPLSSVTEGQTLSSIETFLHAIPHDYYTVKRIGELKAAIDTQNALLIDVRESAEFSGGHIKGAINIPLRSLTDNLTQIPKSRPVVLYCTSGYRTAMGVMALQMLGYENIQGFPPSIQGWKAAGEHLVRAD